MHGCVTQFLKFRAISSTEVLRLVDKFDNQLLCTCAKNSQWTSNTKFEFDKELNWLAILVAHAYACGYTEVSRLLDNIEYACGYISCTCVLNIVKQPRNLFTNQFNSSSNSNFMLDVHWRMCEEVNCQICQATSKPQYMGTKTNVRKCLTHAYNCIINNYIT